MKTVTLYVKKHTKWADFIVYTEYNSTDLDYVTIGKAEFSYEERDTRADAIAALRAQQQQVLAEAQLKATALEERIQSLQALESL
jgi:hypothetical protein